MIVEVCTRRELWADPFYARVLTYWLRLDSYEGITLNGRFEKTPKRSLNARAGLLAAETS